ncbi:MAG: hypothetical protein RLZZ480_758 [Candidatus Parcubacteria bacterium]|jgi:ABC-type glycerol-3-phosphate transport system substrate-binding protein
MKLRPFELGLVVIFLGLIVGSLAFLSVYKPKPDNDGIPDIGTVNIWGTLPSSGVGKLLREFADVDKQYQKVNYTAYSSEEFENALVNALADGAGPDMLLISQEELVALRKRIQPISYESFARPDIRNIYIDGAQIFALSDGLYAYPIAVDPIVMYWNKDIVTNDGFLEAPKTWESLVNDYLPTLVRRNPDRSIVRSVVALGEYGNVQNSFAILSTLLLQAGMVGVIEDESQYYKIKLNDSLDGQTNPLTVSTDFYTRFSRPNNSYYSWNRSFSSDKDRFLSEDLAMYFGYGSEGVDIELKNPNLNFDVTEVPQGAATTVRRTYGKFYGLAALRSSKNLQGVWRVMSTLGSAENAGRLAGEYHLAPAHKTNLAKGSNDVYGRVSYKSAPIAYGWLNPKRQTADDIFKTMTQDINENRGDTSSVINDTLERLRLEYN